MLRKQFVHRVHRCIKPKGFRPCVKVVRHNVRVCPNPIAHHCLADRQCKRYRVTRHLLHQLIVFSSHRRTLVKGTRLFSERTQMRQVRLVLRLVRRKGWRCPRKERVRLMCTPCTSGECQHALVQFQHVIGRPRVGGERCQQQHTTQHISTHVRHVVRFVRHGNLSTRVHVALVPAQVAPTFFDVLKCGVWTVRVVKVPQELFRVEPSGNGVVLKRRFRHEHRARHQRSDPLGVLVAVEVSRDRAQGALVVRVRVVQERSVVVGRRRL